LCTPSGTFRLTLEFSEDYPNKAPVVKFKSQMFHPNSECPGTQFDSHGVIDGADDQGYALQPIHLSAYTVHALFPHTHT